MDLYNVRALCLEWQKGDVREYNVLLECFGRELTPKKKEKDTKGIPAYSLIYSSQQLSEVDTLILILQMRMLKFREVKYISQPHAPKI